MESLVFVYYKDIDIILYSCGQPKARKKDEHFFFLFGTTGINCTRQGGHIAHIFKQFQRIFIEISTYYVFGHPNIWPQLKARPIRLKKCTIASF